jgi:hypothetical protein
MALARCQCVCQDSRVLSPSRPYLKCQREDSWPYSWGLSYAWPLTKRMNLLHSILLVITPVSQAWLIFLLVRRDVHKRFHWFFIYTIFSIAAAGARWCVRGNPWHYFYVYWVAEALYAVCGFLAIFEAFRWVFRHFYLMWWWFRFVLPSVGALILGIAIIKGILFPPIQAPPALAVIFVSELAVRCLQGGIFALFVALVRFHSMPARTYAFGISLGFAISSFGILLTVLLRSESGIKLAPLLELSPSVTYIIAVAIWVTFFIKPERPDPFMSAASSISSEQVIEILQQYTRTFKDFFKRCFSTNF